MPRRPRVELEGGVYHVYNRLASGERVFSDAEIAADFVGRIAAVKARDGWTVFAWCVMANHYHFAIRTATVPLSESLHALQGQFSRTINRRDGRTGSRWQSRYHAKVIDEQRYLSQVVLYIHLNPVRAGVTDDPAEYLFAGHREIVRRLRAPLVDVDDALLCFGPERRSARRAYLAGIRAGLAEAEGGDAAETPGGKRWWDRIPWSDRALELQAPTVQRLSRRRTEERPAADVLVNAACKRLGVTLEAACGPGRDRAMAAARRVLAVVLCERWGVPRREVAQAMRRNPEVVSHWVSEGRSRAADDRDLGERIDRLDAALQERFLRTEATR